MVPRTLIGCSLLVLALSALFGIFHLQRQRGMQMALTQSTGQRPPELPAAREIRPTDKEAVGATNVDSRLTDPRDQAETADAALAKLTTENHDLQAKLQADQSEIAQLQKQIKVAAEKAAVMADRETASRAELEGQLEEARKQLNAAEREKALLAEKMSNPRERLNNTKAKRRPATGGNPGIRGTVLAVNQAYNFVVLNLGGREGVEPNTEMLIFRGTTFIGKIRVSSVEPATTIGDIVTNSLARGVQVLPGDTVVYAGTNF